MRFQRHVCMKFCIFSYAHKISISLSIYQVLIFALFLCLWNETTWNLISTRSNGANLHVHSLKHAKKTTVFIPGSHKYYEQPHINRKTVVAIRFDLEAWNTPKTVHVLPKKKTFQEPLRNPSKTANQHIWPQKSHHQKKKSHPALPRTNSPARRARTRAHKQPASKSKNSRRQGQSEQFSLLEHGRAAAAAAVQAAVPGEMTLAALCSAAEA